jgi:hypothetical protein
MRLAFLILLLANGALFFWGQGYLGASAAGREPERLGRQKAPEQLRILPADTVPLPVAPPKLVAACKRIEWLSGDEAASLRDTLGTLPDWQLQLTPQPQAPAHWVVIPALANRVQAERKKAELQQLGVKQGEIVEDAELGPFAVSLGVFRDRQRADEFLQSLTKKGVRSAQIGKRELPAEKFSLELRAPAAVLDSKLPDLMATLPQASAQDCAAP